MQPRIIITLQKDEYLALLNISEREYRPVRLHAEMIFRDALIERGIIENSESQSVKKSKSNNVRRATVQRSAAITATT